MNCRFFFSFQEFFLFKMIILKFWIFSSRFWGNCPKIQYTLPCRPRWHPDSSLGCRGQPVHLKKKSSLVNILFSQFLQIRNFLSKNSFFWGKSWFGNLNFRAKNIWLFARKLKELKMNFWTIKCYFLGRKKKSHNCKKLGFLYNVWFWRKGKAHENNGTTQMVKQTKKHLKIKRIQK